MAIKNLRHNGHVLEIGSGHRPRENSTILCDKYIKDNTERHGNLKRFGRPMVAADGQALPFRNGAFEYVTCSHVLEHADNVEQFIGEITRVGDKGYVETPSVIAEWMFGWPYHKWIFVMRGDKLKIARKKLNSPAGPIFHHLYNNDLAFQTVFYSYLGIFNVSLEWQGSIPYEIVDEEDLLGDYPAAEIIEKFIDGARPQYRATFTRHLKNRLRHFRNSHKTPLPEPVKNIIKKMMPDKA